ncbi:MAG: ASCH domain-containing protein, partial [Phycisphaerae bacterium]|nr:ASCH domain-containing protein [Phycisphaerae bacterium]
MLMKCVTIYQPWAWLWLHGPKRVENRGWRLAHRGPLAIHAGRRQDKWMRGFYDDPVLHELVPECPPPAGLRYGAIIGVVDIVDCVLL